jgi:primary-amine oxidase
MIDSPPDVTIQVHPLDPLSAAEIIRAVAAVRDSRPDPAGLRFVQVDLLEPPKAQLLAFVQGDAPRPERMALAIV